MPSGTVNKAGTSGQAATNIIQVAAATGSSETGPVQVQENGGSSTIGTSNRASTPGGQSVTATTMVNPAGGSNASGPSAVIRTGGIDTRVPNNSLFVVRSEPGSRYLVETDPQFANYRSWLSSDYLLKAVANDPATTQKRLGDGFYEQKLIREQIAQLTGRRFLDNYTNDEEYLALMDSGATFARQFNLQPGIGLSAEQMAVLTSDIVWLVEQDGHAA